MAELFDKVKQEIEKGLSTVSIKSKEVLESMKIKKQVDMLNEQITSAFTELGQMIYTMFNQNNIDQAMITEKSELISILKKQLAEKEVELNQLHLEAGEALGKTFCSHCKAEIHEDSKYCRHCGQKIAEQAGSQTEVQ